MITIITIAASHVTVKTLRLFDRSDRTGSGFQKRKLSSKKELVLFFARVFCFYFFDYPRLLSSSCQSVTDILQGEVDRPKSLGKNMVLVSFSRKTLWREDSNIRYSCYAIQENLASMIKFMFLLCVVVVESVY